MCLQGASGKSQWDVKQSLWEEFQTTVRRTYCLKCLNTAALFRAFASARRTLRTSDLIAWTRWRGLCGYLVGLVLFFFCVVLFCFFLLCFVFHFCFFVLMFYRITLLVSRASTPNWPPLECSIRLDHPFYFL